MTTATDFHCLALACMLRRFPSRQRLNLHLLFHYPVWQGDDKQRSDLFGRQMAASLNEMRDHNVRLYATTQPLARQMRSVAIPTLVLPYPIRPITHDSDDANHTNSQTETHRKRILFGGMLRAEKGIASFRNLLATIHRRGMLKKQYQVSAMMQARQCRWLIPPSLRREHPSLLATATSGNHWEGPLHLHLDHLESGEFQRWLGTGDIAVFLYDPERYKVRLSSVMLETMSRGVPCIVPDHCWLAEMVRQHSDRGPIGYVYQHPEEIPNLLADFADQCTHIQRNAASNAERILKMHESANVVRQMTRDLEDKELRQIE
ncbi:MAG: hypothetical protein AAFP90_10175 [Planctomycetota bacterium]